MGAYGTTYNVYGPAFIMLIRNIALLVAAVDATWTMVRVVRGRQPVESSLQPQRGSHAA
ncbi:MAG TPA: hypothetical protein VFG58_04095 [Solirubrobacterales bacterium]|nr:hypothetical protein [Solirubrobacterales bacterium]